LQCTLYDFIMGTIYLSTRFYSLLFPSIILYRRFEVNFTTPKLNAVLRTGVNVCPIVIVFIWQFNNILFLTHTVVLWKVLTVLLVVCLYSAEERNSPYRKHQSADIIIWVKGAYVCLYVYIYYIRYVIIQKL